MWSSEEHEHRGDECGGERSHLSNSGGSSLICLDEAGINTLNVGKSIWEQQAGPKSLIAEESLAYEVFQSARQSSAQHCLLEKSPALTSSSPYIGGIRYMLSGREQQEKTGKLRR